MAEFEQPTYFSDSIAPMRRSRSDELFLLIIEARPDPNADEYGEAGGAFVNCWVHADDLCLAERKAVAMIQEHRWRPHRFDSWELVTRETYADWEPSDDGESDPRDVVARAFTDGVVCEFCVWPVNAPDAGQDDPC